MKFIIHDERDMLQRDDNGTIISDGITGRIGADNAFLSIYAALPDNAPDLRSLDVGASIRGVSFSMSGGRGVYSVLRVS